MREAMNPWNACLVGLLLTSCATSDTVGTQTGGNTSTGSSGASTSSGSSGGGPTRTDAIPLNGIGFFQVPACPTGWEPFKAAAGRALLPTIGTAPGGTTVGEPLASGEDRPHTHNVPASFELIDISYVGIASGGNNGVTNSGTASFMTTSDAASTGLPYVQLLACKKMASPEAAAKPLPTGMQIYFDASTCPSGWKQAPATQGRFIVGLPKGAPADISFGGEPMSNAMPRTHAHGNEVTLETVPHGIALAAGCCGSGYAKNAIYTSTTDTDAAETGLPWIELLHCEKL